MAKYAHHFSHQIHKEREFKIFRLPSTSPLTYIMILLKYIWTTIVLSIRKHPDIQRVTNSEIVLRVDAASTTQACDSGSGVCVAFQIPVTAQTTADTADILVTVQAPGSLGWVGFGFGQQMSGSLVFVMWPDNTDIVVSPRLGRSVFTLATLSQCAFN